MSHSVFLEVIYLSVRDGDLFYRVEHLPLPASVAPDVFLHDYLALPEVEADGSVLHSTSWRYDAELGIVLTWLLTPDPLPGAAASPVLAVSVSAGDTGYSPVPDDLTVDGVVNHAVRHLRFLLHNDPVIGEALHERPGLHDALLAVYPDVAGGMGHRH